LWNSPEEDDALSIEIETETETEIEIEIERGKLSHQRNMENIE